MDTTSLRTWRNAVEADLTGNILPFWKKLETADGYLGGLKNDLTPLADFPIGLIMVARLLWTYSRAHRLRGDMTYLESATRAYLYLLDHFEDKEHGGFYWMLDPAGRPLETKKQTYGQAFMIYGMSEYFMATGDTDSLKRAMALFDLLEQKTWNSESGGYWEAYGREWQLLEDVRLSDKDINAPLTMNTHLHVMEAYANLLLANRTPEVEAACRKVVRVATDRIIRPSGDRFGLFYSKDWELINEEISPGHDIEGSWLLWETAEIIDDPNLLEQVRSITLAMAEHVFQVGIDTDGGIISEFAPGHSPRLGKCWWPQSEAVIGFLNAYQLSGDSKFMDASLNAWQHIVDKFIDHENGEWFSEYTLDGQLTDLEKAGPWKSSYHNGRMGFEVVERLGKLVSNSGHLC
ncbi:MAG: AGE family epimerase/isomerase [Puniceicoccaceae bacterium]